MSISSKSVAQDSARTMLNQLEEFIEESSIREGMDWDSIITILTDMDWDSWMVLLVLRDFCSLL